MRSEALSWLRRPAALSAGAPDAPVSQGQSGGGAKGATPCPAPLRPACHHFAALFLSNHTRVILNMLSNSGVLVRVNELFRH